MIPLHSCVPPEAREGLGFFTGCSANGVATPERIKGRNVGQENHKRPSCTVVGWYEEISTEDVSTVINPLLFIYLSI